jgi:hypothetical protein
VFELVWIVEALERWAARDPSLRQQVVAPIRERLARAIGFDRVALRVTLDRLGVE